MKITLLDGPMGTQLIEQGHECSSPAWSAEALVKAPEAILSIHEAYASAGATIHTSNTFRTRPADMGTEWMAMARRAVELARAAAHPDHRVAGSIAPLADCYRPDLSPPDPGPRHAQLAEVLAHSGVDILLCETFPHVPEALSAVEAAVDTGIETWLSLTAGPAGTLLDPDSIRAGAEQAIQRGAKGSDRPNSGCPGVR